jgi:hypothetical protein
MSDFLHRSGLRLLPRAVRKDISEHFTPEERKQFLAIALRIGAFSGFIPALPLVICVPLLVVFPEWRNWFTISLCVVVFLAAEAWAYWRNERRVTAFLLSTAWAKERGYAQSARPGPQER